MRCLSLFAKHWTPGKVKTRLAAEIGEERAAEVYRLFVVTLIERLSDTADRRAVYFAPKDRRDAFENLIGADWRLLPQRGGGLGERMHQMFVEELSSPEAHCVLLGTDSPNVPLEYVDAAFDALGRVQLVLGPTEDGGYYLIGARGELPPVLDDMPFSTPRLWQATMDRLDKIGWREGEEYFVLPAWYDIDTAKDLKRLQTDLSERPVLDDSALANLGKTLGP